jgi:hypothetical protein
MSISERSYNFSDTDKWAELESNKADTQEAEFRESYSRQLRGKKQQVYDSHMGHNALEEERKQVNQQAMKTPGRRGEIIKNEEIDKEISRRYSQHKKRNITF